MGEIADMMLDGTMDPETGEWNFGGEDGPGWPMTAREAAAYSRDIGHAGAAYGAGTPFFRVTKVLRKKIERFGVLQNNDAFHWQVRGDIGPNGKRSVIADWWPHKTKYRVGGKMMRGGVADFIRALEKATGQ